MLNERNLTSLYSFDFQILLRNFTLYNSTSPLSESHLLSHPLQYHQAPIIICWEVDLDDPLPNLKLIQEVLHCPHDPPQPAPPENNSWLIFVEISYKVTALGQLTSKSLA